MKKQLDHKKFANHTVKLRKQEEQINKLTESLKKYKNLFNNTFTAKFIVDHDGKILEVNKVACSRYGYNLKEFSKISFFDITLQSCHDSVKDYLHHFKSNKFTLRESKHVSKDGTILIVELNSKIFQYENKSGILIIARDISKMKKCRMKLESQSHLFQVLRDNMPDKIYFKDINSNFILINKAQAKNLQLENPEDAIGKCDHDFFDKKHADQALKDEKKIIKSRKAVIAKTEREKVLSPNREYVYVNSTKVPIINNNNEVIGTFGISRNISELKNAENRIKKYAKELQTLNSTKDKFFSIITHELKNPFFSLLGYSELLMNDYDKLTTDEQKEYLANITKISKNSYHLLETLLQWTGSQAGRIEFSPREIELKSFIENLIDFFQPISKRKNITIQNNVKNSAKAYADSDMMRTVISNLITNAIKFTNHGGEVKIDATSKNNYFKIVISDNGIGMDNETLKNLFQMEARRNSTGTSKERGTGFGLIISKEFVENNGGQLTIKSSLGKGSKFSFTIPKFG